MSEQFGQMPDGDRSALDARLAAFEVRAPLKPMPAFSTWLKPRIQARPNASPSFWRRHSMGLILRGTRSNCEDWTWPLVMTCWPAWTPCAGQRPIFAVSCPMAKNACSR